MRLARYYLGGEVRIEEAPRPQLPPGGLIVRTEACGLCSGELMEWYMDDKCRRLNGPHVLGHELVGVVEESEVPRFKPGTRVFVHHHAPCLACERCARGAEVHCAQWRRTSLDPGGMAEYFGVRSEGLTDVLDVGDLPPQLGALVEPLACVLKGVRRARIRAGDRVAVLGAGALGRMHGFALPGAVLYDPNAERLRGAAGVGLPVSSGEDGRRYDVAFVCPGSVAAVQDALGRLEPEGTLVMFAPLPPGVQYPPEVSEAYFRDLTLVHTYSCGPQDTRAAMREIKRGIFSAEAIVSDYVALEELPMAYKRMQRAEILKAMVTFS